MQWMWIVILGTSIWVLFDAKSIGVRKGQLKGFFDLSPTGWLFGCVVLWIVAFPAYLAKRGEYKRINQGSNAMVFCSACGKRMHGSAASCPQCGAAATR